MSKNYNHLSCEQRYQIEALIKSGHTQKYVAAIIGVHASTVSRELKRNTPRCGLGSKQYWASNAQRRTDLRHAGKFKVSFFKGREKEICRTWLQEYKYSPELISVEGKRVFGSFVSHETIYKWIWACKTSNKGADRLDRKLYLKLRHARRRQKRGNRHDKRGNIPHRVSIERRPLIVQKRSRLGDLEVDLMVGSKHQSAILVSLDRASLKIKLHKLLSKHSQPVKQALVRAYGKERRWIRTITFDNDSAFMLHYQIAQSLGVKTFFTRPYTSQDKGSVENRIGIIRRFLPKGIDLNAITRKEIREIENKINNRPVRKFNYKTPNQVFSEKIALMT